MQRAFLNGKWNRQTKVYSDQYVSLVIWSYLNLFRFSRILEFATDFTLLKTLKGLNLNNRPDLSGREMQQMKLQP